MRRFTFFMVFSMVFCVNLMSQPVPVAYYPFNGNANDAGSNAINGVLYGNPSLTTDNSGNANSAYAFDGVDDYINLGSSMVLKPDSQVSLALWANAANWASFTSWAALAGNTASGGYELIVHGASATIEAECKRNGNYAIADYPLANLSAGWHHFAFTFDGRYTILYVDGIAVDTDDAGAVYPIQYGYPGNSTIIGDEAGSGNTPEGDPFTGKIDEVRFYDVALTAQEILALYNASMNTNSIEQTEGLAIPYPNPATGSICVGLPESKLPYHVVLTDFTGRTVVDMSEYSKEGLVFITRPATLPAGLSLLNISHDEGISLGYKVVFE